MAYSDLKGGSPNKIIVHDNCMEVFETDWLREWIIL